MSWYYPGDERRKARAVGQQIKRAGGPSGFSPLTKEERERMVKKRKDKERGLGAGLADHAADIRLKLAEIDALYYEAEGALNELEDRFLRQQRREAERNAEFARKRARSY